MIIILFIESIIIIAMKVKTFNTVFTVLAILFLGYSIVCAILLSRQGDVHDEHMTWYVWVWVAFGIGIIVWMLYYGSKSEYLLTERKKKVYHLYGMDDDCNHCAYLIDNGDCSNKIGCPKFRYDDYPDDVGDKNLM
jgi:hypothetical protein